MKFFSSFALRGLLLSLYITSALASQLFNGTELILVMGTTASGKSSFINLASGSELQIGHGLESCTSAVQSSKPFKLEGRTIVLIDTPGFDDSTKSDADNLIAIKDSLAEIYESGKMLTGIVYMHRISDYKIGGINRKNFDMFCKMCGNSTYPNVVLVTNMWGDVRQELGEARERQLKTDDGFFASVIGQGATLLRHDNTSESTRAILRHMLRNQPVPLTIQREAVDLKLPLKDMEAGKVLYREVKEQMEAREKDKAEWEARREQEKAEWEARHEQEKAEWGESRDQDKAKWEEDKASWEARREQDKTQWEESRKQDKADSEEKIRKMEAEIADYRRPRHCWRVYLLGVFQWEYC